MQQIGTNRGQSLVEILIAVAIGAVLVVAGAAMIAPALQSNAQATKEQAASSLGKELIDNVRAWSGGNWNNVLALATGTANHYYLNTTSSPFAPATGTQSIVITSATSSVTYSRYFYLSNVYRDSNGNVVTNGGTYDPSTEQVTVVYGWSGGSTGTMSTYVVRGNNNVFFQNDWSGGPGQAGPVTSTGNQFASSSSIDYSTSTGSLYVSIPGY